MGDTVLIETTADEVVSIVTAGPQGPSGSEAATLTTTGDLLYRAALANDRLPIGSEGQVLKVSSGLPAWGNESGTVTSVAGRTGAVTLAVADVANAVSDSDARLTDARTPTSHTHGNLSNDGKIGVTSGLPLKTGTAGAVEAGAFGTGAGEFCEGNDARLSDARTPTTHAASHAAGGTDAIAPSDIGAQSIFVSESITLSGDTTLSAARAKIWTINSFSASTRFLTLPTSPVAGDVAIIIGLTLLGNVEVVSGSTLAVLEFSAIPQRYRFVYTTSWALDPVPTHNHFASQITSGTLTHERGGLEADVSAYDGLLKISGGSTSAVAVTTAGEALLDDADAAAQRTTLGLGTVASSNSYTDLDNQPSIPSALNDLSNVSAATPNDNDVLVYDNATSTWVAEAPAAPGIAETLLDAKGDLIVASADNTAARLAVGSNGYVLTADSGETTGVKWAALPAGGSTNLWIPASAWIPKTTAGCGVDSRETTTNDQNFDELLFDAGSDEFADALVVMPSNYNNGTVTARFYWTAASGSGGVAWAIQGRAFANDDALDTAAGTAQLVTDTLIAADDMHVTSATSAVTIGGTPAANTPIQFSIYRDVSDAADDLAVDARLLGVEIIFN